MALGTRRLKQLAALAAVGGALVAGLALPADAAGKPGIVKTKDGKTYQGEVDDTSKPGFVFVKPANGPPYQLNKANVDTVTIFATNAEEFQTRMANLGKQDVAGRVALARWALTKNEPELAAQAVAAIQAIDPNNAEAAVLAKQVAAVRPPPPVATQVATQPAVTQPATAEAVKPPVGPAVRMLTPEEIQLVRAREMIPGEKVRLQVPPVLRKKAVADGLLTAKEMGNLRDDRELAALIFQRGSPELQREIKVVGEPAALAAYRTKVNRALVTGCATAACHGGPAGGRLLLYGPANNEIADLTNFVILQKFEGTGGGVPRSMIDRTQPLNSLLLGYMLPANVSKVPHPEVQGFRPPAKSANDPTFVAARDWMGKTLSVTVPNYDDIDLTQPAKPAGAADKPAGAAAR